MTTETLPEVPMAVGDMVFDEFGSVAVRRTETGFQPMVCATGTSSRSFDFVTVGAETATMRSAMEAADRAWEAEHA